MISSRFIVLPVIISLAVSIQYEVVQGRFVKLIDRNRTTIDIGRLNAENTTLGKLKEIIATKTSIDRDRLRLVNNINTPFLDDEKLVSGNLDVNQEAIVHLCGDLQQPGQINIIKKWKGSQLIVSKNETLAYLKGKVLDEDERKLYHVFYAGRELTDDSKTLGQYNFYEGCFITMFTKDYKFLVEVSFSAERSKTFKFTIETKVEDLRQMIEEEGVSTKNKLLLYKGVVLEDEKKLISYSKWFHLSMLVDLVECLGDSGGILEMFYYKDDFLTHFPVFATPSNTVADLKRFTYSSDGSIPANQMKLKLGELTLGDDSRKLSEFKLYDQIWIYVERIQPAGERNQNAPQVKTTIRPFSRERKKPTTSQHLGEECSICYEPFSKEEEEVVTNCGHKFHRKCLVAWKDQGGSNCPSCRSDLEGKILKMIEADD